MDAIARIRDRRQAVHHDLEAVAIRLVELEHDRQRLTGELSDLAVAERVLQRLMPETPGDEAVEAVEPINGPIAEMADPVKAPTLDDRAPDLSKSVSQKDMVLIAARDLAPALLDRDALITRIKQLYGVEVKKDSITTALLRWKAAGRVRTVGRLWQYVPEGAKDAGPREAPEETEASNGHARDASVLAGEGSHPSLWTNPQPEEAERSSAIWLTGRTLAP
jgi:hypothetical protein